jgi:D-sedoheptulose 7-phosphate isomerase
MKNRLEQMFDSSGSAADFMLQYAERLREILAEIDFESLEKLVSLIKEAGDSDQVIFLAGNGGSAAICSHLANDFAALAHEGGRPRFRTMSLTDNAPLITALANDTGFENIFVHQLMSLFRPGDLLVVMSGSGNSENLIRAARYVNDNGGVSAGVLGFDGGMLMSLCRHVLHIKTQIREYGPVEDAFMIFAHMLTTYLAFDMGLFDKPEGHPCYRLINESSIKK